MVHQMYWACPACCGEFVPSPEPSVRCVACGKTMTEWSQGLPKKATIQSTLYPDAVYERPAIISDDPS